MTHLSLSYYFIHNIIFNYIIIIIITVKNQLLWCPKPYLEVYGEVYFKAWRLASGPYLKVRSVNFCQLFVVYLVVCCLHGCLLFTWLFVVYMVVCCIHGCLLFTWLFTATGGALSAGSDVHGCTCSEDWAQLPFCSTQKSEEEGGREKLLLLAVNLFPHLSLLFSLPPLLPPSLLFSLPPSLPPSFSYYSCWGTSINRANTVEYLQCYSDSTVHSYGALSRYSCNSSTSVKDLRV